MRPRKSDQDYSARVAKVIAEKGPDEAILVLLKDRRLKAIDEKARNEFKRLAPNSADELRERFAEYKAAERAFHNSPRGKLEIFVKTLPLIRLSSLARKSKEIAVWADEEYRFIDRERQVKGARVLSNTKSVPHPLEAILRRHRKGGGPLGSHRLAEELNRYCWEQLKGFAAYGQKPNRGHFGKVNAWAVLNTVYKPRKAQREMSYVLENIRAFITSQRPPCLFTAKAIDSFIKRPIIQKTLPRITYEHK